VIPACNYIVTIPVAEVRPSLGLGQDQLRLHSRHRPNVIVVFSNVLTAIWYDSVLRMKYCFFPDQEAAHVLYAGPYRTLSFP
jgi:hypothetical protein